MSRRSRRATGEILSEALSHLELAQHYASGEIDDQLRIDAICMRLSAGIEALSQLDHATRESFFGAAWPAMWGMRNRIAHGYLLIEARIVRSTLERDVPAIIVQIREASEQLPGEP